MSEQLMRQKVVRALKPLHALSVENPCQPGTPDVNYVGGWIELKQVKGWARGHLPAIPHYTKQQRIWLRRRWEAGGVALFVLQIGKEWLVFPGDIASALESGQMEKFVRKAALRSWEKWPGNVEFLEFIRKVRCPRPRIIKSH